MNEKPRYIMEFITVYGWVILLVLIAISALLYYVPRSNLYQDGSNMIQIIPINKTQILGCTCRCSTEDLKLSDLFIEDYYIKIENR